MSIQRGYLKDVRKNLTCGTGRCNLIEGTFNDIGTNDDKPGTNIGGDLG